jgi:hypothetical protein
VNNKLCQVEGLDNETFDLNDDISLLETPNEDASALSTLDP